MGNLLVFAAGRRGLGVAVLGDLVRPHYDADLFGERGPRHAEVLGDLRFGFSLGERETCGECECPDAERRIWSVGQHCQHPHGDLLRQEADLVCVVGVMGFDFGGDVGCVAGLRQVSQIVSL